MAEYRCWKAWLTTFTVIPINASAECLCIKAALVGFGNFIFLASLKCTCQVCGSWFFCPCFVEGFLKGTEQRIPTHRHSHHTFLDFKISVCYTPHPEVPLPKPQLPPLECMYGYVPVPTVGCGRLKCV